MPNQKFGLKTSLKFHPNTKNTKNANNTNKTNKTNNNLNSKNYLKIPKNTKI